MTSNIYSVVQALLILVNMIILSNKKVDKTIISLFAVFAMINPILNQFWQISGIYLILTEYLILFIAFSGNKENSKQTLVFLNIAVIAVFLSEIVAFLLNFTGTHGYFFRFQTNQVRYILMYLGIDILIVLACKKMFAKFKLQKHNKVLLLVTSLNIIVYVFLILYVSVIAKQREIMSEILIYLLIPAVNIILIFTYIYKREKDFLKESEEQATKALNEYYLELDNNYKEMRKYRHDFLNVLSSLGILIEDGNIEKIQRYYEEITNQTLDKMNSAKKGIEELNKINIKEIKGILFQKVRKMEFLNINYDVEILDNINCLSINYLDLVRVLGNILDNAIEEVEYLVKGYISIKIIKNNSRTSIYVENTTRDQVKPLYELKKEGYSSKGANRGFGLANIDEILGKYENVYLETIVENKTFVQIISIYDNN